MSKNVISVNKDQPIIEVIKELNKNRIGAVVIINHGKLLGILTVRDLINCL